MIKDKLRKLYCDRQLSMMEVANEFGTTHAKVYYWLRKYGIPRRSWSDSAYVKQNPKGDPFTIPENFSCHQQELLKAGLLLYWAEGNKGKDAIRLANLDSRMLILFLKFLREVCRVDEERIYVYVRVQKEFSLDDARQYWVNILRLPVSHIYVYPHTDKRSKLIQQKSRHGIATLEFHSTKLKQWLDTTMEEYIEKLMNRKRDGMKVKRSIFLTFFVVFLLCFHPASSFAEKLTILKEDQICQKDEDCMGVETDCERGGCECPGEPVNIKFEEKYKKLLEECRKGKMHTLCEPICRPGSIKCVENICVFVEQKVNN